MSANYELDSILEVLHRGGTILYPTDTIWGIGCDATNAKAVASIYRIKERVAEKSMIILVRDVEMLKQYVPEPPEIAFELINSVSEPLTIIYPGARNLPGNILAADGSVAIRIPKHEFCETLLEVFGKPLSSTSANVSGMPNPFSYRGVSEQVKSNVDFIVPYEQSMASRPKPSIIIKIDKKGEMHIIRN